MYDKTLATKREQYAYALRQYQQAPAKSKLQLSRWEMLRWAVNALNVVLAARQEALVEMPAAPWALTEREVFDLSYSCQQHGLGLVQWSGSAAVAA